jgi:hypothetical protein
MCSNLVFTELQSITPAQGAHVALMAAVIKTEMLKDRVPGGSATIRDIAESPATYSKELCYTAFCILEGMRELARARVRSYTTNRIVPPRDVLGHMELCDLALSLWMVTIGVGCSASTLEQVSSCWNHVASFSSSASDIKAIMLRSDYGCCTFRGQPIATNEWIWIASQRPAFLEETMLLDCNWGT